MRGRFGFYFLSLFVFNSLFIAQTLAENFKYSELQIKDYDEMKTLVRDRITASKKAFLDRQKKGKNSEEADRQAIEVLRNALKLILSRPNDDNMLAKLLPFVRSELNNYSAFEDTLASLTQESVRSISNDKIPSVYRSTSLFLLENVMSEIRPEISKKEGFKKLVEFIRDAKIVVPESVKNERRLRSMQRSKNPSEMAETILKEEGTDEATRNARAAKLVQEALDKDASEKAKKDEKGVIEDKSGHQEDPELENLDPEKWLSSRTWKRPQFRHLNCRFWYQTSMAHND